MEHRGQVVLHQARRLLRRGWRGIICRGRFPTPLHPPLPPLCRPVSDESGMCTYLEGQGHTCAGSFARIRADPLLTCVHDPVSPTELPDAHPQC